MAQIFPELTAQHRVFIASQHLFFVGTAPSGAAGDVNLSPKGYDAFRILSSREVAYLDLTGSGNETSGHLAENHRITVMFCAFEGSPLILRIYGTGEVVLPSSARWDELSPQFILRPGARQIIVVGIREVQTSCGFGVPLMDYRQDRDTLERWAVQKGDTGLDDYWRTKNASTRNGLPTPLGESLLTGAE